MKIIHGDSLDKLKELEDNSIDSIVTDPPYGLSFMGKKWDYDVPSQEIWEECLRVLKPGGYLLAFAGTRTQHRMAVRIEDAGFEIRDMIAWVYGSGFPKSHNIGKAVDKLQGNEREPDEYTGANFKNNVYGNAMGGGYTQKYGKGNSPYEGYGTALKPALEPITVARKPISEKTVAENVLKYGTGGINIDGCRVEASKDDNDKKNQRYKYKFLENKGSFVNSDELNPDRFNKQKLSRDNSAIGRFPANLIHDGSDEVVGLFPDSKSSDAIRKNNNSKTTGINTFGKYNDIETTGYSDSGSASRFFYCAKASKSERNKGCEEFEKKENAGSYEFRTDGSLDGKPTAPKANFHPTVKPISLMRYLCRLVTPKGGTVLDPFMGSGTTGIGAKLEGFDFIGIEREEEYIKIAEARINAWEKEKQKKLV
jgi:DNA modification methylase